MWIGPIVFLSQTLFNIFKVLEIKYTYQNKIVPLLINSVWLNLVSLVSVYYSIDSLLRGEFFIIVFYILGGLLGKFIGMKLGNPRNRIWTKVFGERKPRWSYTKWIKLSAVPAEIYPASADITSLTLLQGSLIYETIWSLSDIKIHKINIMTKIIKIAPRGLANILFLKIFFK